MRSLGEGKGILANVRIDYILIGQGERVLQGDPESFAYCEIAFCVDQRAHSKQSRQKRQ